MGDEGFAPFDSLVEGFRVALTGVFLLVGFDWAGFPSEEVGDRGLPDCPPSVVLGDSEAATLLPSRFGASVTLIFGSAASDMARAVP